jgi:hypothetical protein
MSSNRFALLSLSQGEETTSGTLRMREQQQPADHK